VVDLIADDGIETGGGFIVEDGRRAADDGPGEATRFRIPPERATGIFSMCSARPTMVSASTARRSQFVLVAHAHLAERKDDIFPHGHRIEKRAILEKHADFPADRADGAFVQFGDFLSFDLDGAFVGIDQADEQAEQDTFAPAAGPEDGSGAAGWNIEVHPAQHFLPAKGCASSRARG
jgi:hypothetical protein